VNVNIKFLEEIKSGTKINIKSSPDKMNSIKKLRGIWESRRDIADSSIWVQSQRRLIDKRMK
jgi:hypothetical protein